MLKRRRYSKKGDVNTTDNKIFQKGDENATKKKIFQKGGRKY